MAEENKHPPTTEEQAPPEMSGKAPEMEQAEIPDVGGGPAPSAKVIDLSADLAFHSWQIIHLFVAESCRIT